MSEIKESPIIHVIAWVIAKAIRHWKIIFLSWLLGVLIFGAIAFSLKNNYEARTTVVFQGERPDGLSIGNLAGLSGLLGASSGDEPPDLIKSVLRSNALALDGIKKFNLIKEWKIDTTKLKWENLAIAWSQKFTFWLDDENSLCIAFQSESPALSAAVLNYAVAWADSVYRELKQEHALKNMMFYDKLASERLLLFKASEDSLIAFQKKHVLSEPSIEGDVANRIESGVQEEIIQQEGQIAILRQTQGEKSSAYQSALSRVGYLKNKSNEIQSSILGKNRPVNAKVRIDVWLEFERLKREVQIQGGVYQILVQQLEQSKIDVRKSLPIFYIVDPVRVPMKKISPPRGVILFLGGLIGIFFGSCIALFGSEIRLFKEVFKVHYKT